MTIQRLLGGGRATVATWHRRAVGRGQRPVAVRWRALAACAVLAVVCGFAQTQGDEGAYERYVKTSRDFRRVRHSPAWLLRAWPNWIYMPWYFRWRLGFGPEAARFQKEKGYFGSFVDGSTQWNGRISSGAEGSPSLDQPPRIPVLRRPPCRQAGLALVGWRRLPSAAKTDGGFHGAAPQTVWPSPQGAP